MFYFDWLRDFVNITIAYQPSNQKPKTLFEHLERYLNEILNEIQYCLSYIGKVSFGNQANEVEIVNFLGLTKFEYSIVTGIAELLNFQRYAK